MKGLGEGGRGGFHPRHETRHFQASPYFAPPSFVPSVLLRCKYFRQYFPCRTIQKRKNTAMTGETNNECCRTGAPIATMKRLEKRPKKEIAKPIQSPLEIFLAPSEVSRSKVLRSISSPFCLHGQHVSVGETDHIGAIVRLPVGFTHRRVRCAPNEASSQTKVSFTSRHLAGTRRQDGELAYDGKGGVRAG